MNLPRCAGCNSLEFCPIPMDGPLDAEVACIGERPGQVEEFKIRKALSNGYYDPTKAWCFVGDAGIEFTDNYLRLAGLSRERVRVGNTVLCGADGNKHPGDRQAFECAAFHLSDDFRATNRLKLIVLMGGVACSLLDDFDLEAEHGIPRRVSGWFGYSGWIVGVYHPAAALHQTSYMIPLLADWEAIGRWLNSGMTEWQWAVDRFEEHDFRLARMPHEVVKYFEDYGFEPKLIGVDTERHGRDPFSIQVSHVCGTGLMVLEEDRDAMDMLACSLGIWITHGAELTMHNAEADLEPVLRHLRPLGIKEFKYRDSMVELYHLGSFLRLGLKIAALRVLGRRRQSWDEVVGGASRSALIAWLYEALTVSETWRFEVEQVHKRTGKPITPLTFKHPCESELKHMLTHTSKSAEYESWAKVREFGWLDSEWFGQLEREVGRAMPIKGIGNCDLESAVQYGCQDASDHLELALALERLRVAAEKEWSVVEEDRDDVSVTRQLA